jgi:hypothetical protein
MNRPAEKNSTMGRRGNAKMRIADRFTKPHSMFAFIRQFTDGAIPAGKAGIGAFSRPILNFFVEELANSSGRGVHTN